MRIKRLRAQNLQGQTFDHELAPVTAIVGQNFAGKTTRLTGLQLALLGYVPGVAKRPNEVFERLSSGNPLSVRVETDTDLVCERSWTERKGSVKCDGDTITFDVEPIAFDVGEYLALSEPARVRFLFSRSSSGDLTVQRVADSIAANLKNLKPEEGSTPAHEEVIGTQLIFLRTTSASHASTEVQKFVEFMVESVREKLKLAKANVDRQTKASQGIAQVRQVPDADLMGAEGRWRDAKGHHEAASGAVAALRERRRSLCARVGEAEVAERQIAGTEDDQRRLNAVTEEMAPIAERLKSDRPDSNDARSKLKKATDWVAAANSAKILAQAKVDRLNAEIEKAKAQATCPTCGSDMSAHRDKVVGDLMREASNAAAEADKAVAEHSNATASWDISDAEVRAVEERQRAYDKDSADHRRLSNEQRQINERQLGRVHLQAKVSELDGLREDLTQVDDDLSKAEADATTKRGLMESAESDHRRLIQARADAASAARVQEAAAAAEAEATVLKLYAEMLADLQAKMVDEAVGPLLEACNRLCGLILTAPLIYRGGEIGMQRPTGFVSHKTFSGTEKALAYCALSVALASTSPLKIAVIDEMGRLDPLNKGKLIEMLRRLTSTCEIDQAIVVDTVWQFDHFHDVTVIRL